MYCVKCGVRLQDGVRVCPLCGTPVWDPDEQKEREATYSDRLPKEESRAHRGTAVLLLVLAIVAVFSIFLICTQLYRSVAWADLAAVGIATFYLVFILPLWFSDPNPAIFVPTAHVAIAACLLYVCLRTGGHWFLPLAFPITGVHMLIWTAAAVLLRYIEGRRSYIFGGLSIALGGFSILIEFFLHITFGFPMWRWSLFSAGGFTAFGIFLILIGLVPPLKAFMIRRFFY